MDGNFSLVHYFSEQEKHKCGYCKKLKSSATYGMWAQCLTVQDYQELIDRGWRRSGKYCYKPIMDVTCCPMYTIRCEALNLKLSKSQKKILKRVNKFLTEGIKEKLNKSDENMDMHHTPMDTIASTSHKHVEIDETKLITENLINLTHPLDDNDSVSDVVAEIANNLNSEVISGDRPCDENVIVNRTNTTTSPANKIHHLIPTTLTTVVSSPSENQEQSEDQQNPPKDCINEDTKFSLQYKQGNFEVPYVNINLLYVWIEHYLTYPTNISESFYIWLDSLSINDMLRILWEGMDVTKPPCKKAKLMRIERKRQKLAAAGVDLETVQQVTSQQSKQQQEGKSLEQFLSEIPEETKHKLRVTLVRTTPKSEEWYKTSKVSHEVYTKYQMAIHGDSREKCSEIEFHRFLVESPLQIVLKRMTTSDETFTVSTQLYEKYQMSIHKEASDECDANTFIEFLIDTPLKAYYSPQGPSHGYGSFHQQYWLDDNLIAVGVIDILPKCVSSVYFFYDPDFNFLSLGTYGSLRELHLTRELHKTVPDLKYYYMGYYIHSCPKMRYKANLFPSYLLCAETYHWLPIETCLPKLNIDAYVRFNDDSNATDPNGCPRQDIRKIPIFYNYNVMKYAHFRQRYGTVSDNELYEYANLVGKRCASRMLLVKD